MGCPLIDPSQRIEAKGVQQSMATTGSAGTSVETATSLKSVIVNRAVRSVKVLLGVADRVNGFGYFLKKYLYLYAPIKNGYGIIKKDSFRWGERRRAVGERPSPCPLPSGARAFLMHLPRQQGRAMQRSLVRAGDQAGRT